MSKVFRNLGYTIAISTVLMAGGQSFAKMTLWDKTKCVAGCNRFTCKKLDTYNKCKASCPEESIKRCLEAFEGKGAKSAVASQEEIAEKKDLLHKMSECERMLEEKMSILVKHEPSKAEPLQPQVKTALNTLKSEMTKLSQARTLISSHFKGAQEALTACSKKYIEVSKALVVERPQKGNLPKSRR